MKENEIRKREVLNKYLALVQEDCQRIFTDPRNFIQIDCPACGNKTYREQFKKNGFLYVTCDVCQTLYACSRPSFDLLNQFYARSDATSYWVNNFFKPMVAARREKIFKPRAKYVAECFGPDPAWMVGDIGAGFGLFLDELKVLWPASKYVAIEPSVEQAKICSRLGVTVECCALEQLRGYENRFDLLSAFELFEHLHEPIVFLKAAYKLLKPGGKLLATTLNGEGFDIQVLWENSKSIYPPCHINFFNPDSIAILFKEAGFKIEKIETPGQLDWDIVEGMIRNEKVKLERFWELLAVKGDEEAKRSLQNWIIKNNFSSHMRVLARREE